VSWPAAAVAAATLLVAATAGCGFGEGEESEGEATLTVTRDYGSERLLEASREDPPSSETVFRFLDSEAEIATRYGGGFVQSIDGLAGGTEEGRRLDWFFYVNGIESSVGAAEVEVHAGDRIWWDYRDWTAAMRVPAVLGSFPEPLSSQGAGVECRTARAVCDEVRERIPGTDRAGGDAVEVLVGPWRDVRDDRAVRAIERGPATSGVFADFEPAPGGHRLVALDQTAAQARRLGPHAGLIAAVRDGSEPPIWLVTGTDPAGVDRAAELIDEETLRDRYALAVERSGRALPLPVVE
jgi:Domain of unknown function (DUF4430)